MPISWGRLLAGTAVAEIVPLATLIVLVGVMGPANPAEAQEFATMLGRWVGPLGGAAMAIAMTLWVARPLSHGQVLHGALLGTLLAVIDVAILVASGQPFDPIFVRSNVGKVVAGLLGGVIAKRRPRRS
jgi:hypothetical protein